MNREIKISIEAAHGELDIRVDAELRVENDGIGAYEYWGAKGIDRGSDYVELEKFVVLSCVDYQTGFPFAVTPEMMAEIEAKINAEDLQVYLRD